MFSIKASTDTKKTRKIVFVTTAPDGRSRLHLECGHFIDVKHRHPTVSKVCAACKAAQEAEE